MKSMYKKGGKPAKKRESWMEESKEVHFGQMAKKKTGGLYSAKEVADNIKRVKDMNSKQDGAHQTKVNKHKTGGPKGDPKKAPSTAPSTAKATDMQRTIDARANTLMQKRYNEDKAFSKQKSLGIVPVTNTGDTPTDKMVLGAAKALNKKLDKKKTGGKSMEPGGGGRFAKLVSKLKSKGKSEDSAKAIAASAGRKKYGKSKFQAMAAAGKKGLGGLSDSTSSNDAGMAEMEVEKKKKKKKGCQKGSPCFEKANKKSGMKW